VKNALNNTIKIDYDANDNVVRMTDPILHVSTQEYDANDNKTKVIDPLNHSISYTYNAFDQVQTINDPLGNVTTSYYDKSRYLLDRALNLTSVKDPAGYITQFGYDGIGRKLQAANALNYITQYQYDSAGDLLKVIDASSHTTSYQYDQLSRSTAAIFPDGSKEMKIYDANGNIQQEILRDGRSISYQYNKLNQKIERRVNGNLDLDGRLSGSQNTWTMQGSWADFSLSVFMQTLVPGTQSWHSGWIRFRYQDDNNQYFFLIHNSGVLELSRIVGGTKTILSMVTSSYNPSNFNQLSIQADKGVIKVWVNNQLVMNQIDSSPLLSAGQVILEAQAAEVRFANLQVLDIAHDTVQSWDQTVIYGRDIDGNMMETVTSGNGQTSRLVSEPGQWKLSDGGDWKNFLMSANIQTSSAGANAWNTSWVRFRFKDWDNHYYVLLSTSGQLELSKYKGGQKTFLQAKATAYSPFDSHKFQVEARGSFMQVWVDNNLEISYADSDPILDAGQLILESNYAECHFQSMSVADLGDSYSDVQLSFDVQTISSGAASWDTAWMNFRYQDDNNRYYFLMHTTGLMELGRFVGGNKTILAQQSSSYSPLDLHRLEIEALGDKLKVFVDKTLAFDVTDSTPLLLAGGLVIQGNNSQARYENLKIVNPNQQYGDFLLNTLIQTMGTGSQTYHTAFINFRYQDDDNRYYFLIHTTGELELSRVKNGVKTILTTKSSSYSPLDPHNVQIQATGGRIQIMVDGTPAIDWVDSDPILSAGKLALKSDSTVPVYYELNEYKKIFSQDWDEFVAYDYDMNGNIVKVSRNGTESWSNVYDPLNRLTQTTDSFGNSIYYQYDALGRRIQMTYPDGLVITYGYNANNQLAEVREGTSTVLVSYAYDNAGRMITKTLGNGVVSNYTYDNANRLTDLVTSKGGTTLASYSYSYDSRGNRITKSALFGSHTYAYDSINQLTQAIEPNSGQKDYTYDPVNNRATLDESIGLSSYSINSLNQIVQVNNSSGTTNLTWDLKGNLATNINAFSSATYRHDIFNQLLEVKRTGQSMTSFSYDVSNRRIGKSANGVTLQYSWDGNDLVEVRDSSGTVLKKFVYGGGIDAPILMRTDNGDYYYSMDGLGSISELTDASGTLVESYRYDANGNTKLYDDSSNQIAESSIGNPFFYTAREYDFETKLYYYRARYYDPKMGVFLETDPMGYQQGMNLYSYVHNNPLTGTDPMGLADVYITIGGSSGDGNPGSSFPWYDPYNLGPDGVRDVYGEINDISGHGSGIANSNGYHLTEDIFRRGAEESEKRRIQDETAFQRSISAMHDHIEDQRTQNSFVRAGQAFFNTLGNEIGFPNMVTQPEDLAPAGLEAGAMYYSGRAIQHAARRGLSYPNKSIIFQGFMRKSVMLGEASAMVAAFEAGFAIGKGLNAAVDAYNEK
jgi:RHS repeat-associated protein